MGCLCATIAGETPHVHVTWRLPGGLEDLGRVMDIGQAHSCDPTRSGHAAEGTWTCPAQVGGAVSNWSRARGTPSRSWHLDIQLDRLFMCTDLYIHRAVQSSPPSNSGPFVPPKEVLYPLSSQCRPQALATRSALHLQMCLFWAFHARGATSLLCHLLSLSTVCPRSVCVVACLCHIPV